MYTAIPTERLQGCSVVRSQTTDIDDTPTRPRCTLHSAVLQLPRPGFVLMTPPDPHFGGIRWPLAGLVFSDAAGAAESAVWGPLDSGNALLAYSAAATLRCQVHLFAALYPDADGGSSHYARDAQWNAWSALELIKGSTRAFPDRSGQINPGDSTHRINDINVSDCVESFTVAANRLDRDRGIVFRHNAAARPVPAIVGDAAPANRAEAEDQFTVCFARGAAFPPLPAGCAWEAADAVTLHMLAWRLWATKPAPVQRFLCNWARLGKTGPKPKGPPKGMVKIGKGTVTKCRIPKAKKVVPKAKKVIPKAKKVIPKAKKVIPKAKKPAKGCRPKAKGRVKQTTRRSTGGTAPRNATATSSLSRGTRSAGGAPGGAALDLEDLMAATMTSGRVMPQAKGVEVDVPFAPGTAVEALWISVAIGPFRVLPPLTAGQRRAAAAARLRQVTAGLRGRRGRAPGAEGGRAVRGKRGGKRKAQALGPEEEDARPQRKVAKFGTECPVCLEDADRLIGPCLHPIHEHCFAPLPPPPQCPLCRGYAAHLGHIALLGALEMK